MPRFDTAPPIRLCLLLVAAVGTIAAPAPAQVAPVPVEASLAFLEPMMGVWAPTGLPDRIVPADVAQSYEWVVGGKAVRIKEGMRAAPDGTPQMEGMVYWNPATDRVEFVAVAGKGPGQGRLFVGEYRLLADGGVERIYDAYYRSLEDIPGETLGGMRRRYREVYRFTDDDHISSTLEWWRDGAWVGFGRFAEGGFERLR